MQRHESYKPSGVKWLGDVPSHWDIRPGFTCFDENKDRNKKLTEKTVLSLSYGRIVVKSEEKMTGLVPESFDTYQLIKPGDIVIRTTDLQNDKTSLRVGLAKDNGMITSAYLGLRCKPEINPEYVFRLLESYDSLKVFYGMGSGLRQNIDFWDFKRLPVPLPPHDEQDRIVMFLNQKISEIDAAISQKMRLIELLEEQKAILVNKAVTCGITQRAETIDSGIEWLGRIPKSWNVRKIKFCSQIFRGKFTHRPRNDPRLYDGIYPFIQTGDVARSRKFITDFKQTLNEKGLRVSTLIPKGTVVLTIAANVGDIAILGFDACFPDSVVGFLPEPEIERDFFYLALSAMKKQFMASSIQNTQMNLNVDRIGSNSIAIPPKEEQQKIIEWVDEVTRTSEASRTAFEREIKVLQELKYSVITEAVTGRIRT